jgi:hypothetical protein
VNASSSANFAFANAVSLTALASAIASYNNNEFAIYFFDLLVKLLN